MRPAVFVLSCALMCAPVSAQEPEPSPTAEPPPQILPVHVRDFSELPVPAGSEPIPVTVDFTAADVQNTKRDIWEWVPHLTLKYGKTTQGHLESPYWYRIQDRRTDIAKAATYSADLSAGRWSLSAERVRVPERPDLRGEAYRIDITAATIGPVRPGFGARYSASENATVLFTSGGTSVASASQRRMVTGIIDVGVGRYDRSYIRIQGLYGNARLTNSLDLFIDGRVAESPLALYNFSHSDFLGVGATAAIRLYGVSLEGTATCYRPQRPSVALPGDECVVTGGGSVLLPLWLKFGSGAGAFIRATHVDAHSRPPDHSSLQFLDDSITVGITARIP